MNKNIWKQIIFQLYKITSLRIAKWNKEDIVK